jgi:transposase
MIAVLGGLAGVERDLIRTRTAEGRSRAQKHGQRMGRPPKLTDAQQAEARRRTQTPTTIDQVKAALHQAWDLAEDCQPEIRGAIDAALQRASNKLPPDPENMNGNRAEWKPLRSGTSNARPARITTTP